MKGRLFLIPTPLGDYGPERVLTVETLALIPQINLFFVEELRTARRFLSAAGLKGHIDELELHELNEHSDTVSIEKLGQILVEASDTGRDAAVISEAGLPAVADPGAHLVALAHDAGIEVVPQTGPSSLMMALMSSGMNGQCFAFVGYLPVKKEERRARISHLERISQQLGQTQIIIETPYRNDSLLDEILSVCHPATRVCVAADITLQTQFISTRTVEVWRRSKIAVGKRPCVFLLQG